MTAQPQTLAALAAAAGLPDWQASRIAKRGGLRTPVALVSGRWTVQAQHVAAMVEELRELARAYETRRAADAALRRRAAQPA